MPNSPHAETATVSFTMPRALAEAVERHAKANLTNKSDIVRRALLAYLPPEEAAAIIAGSASAQSPKSGGNARKKAG